MKGTFFSADFVKDNNDNLRLIEVNTDTGLTAPQAWVFDWTDFINVLQTNNITEVDVVYKYDIQSAIVNSLSSSLAASASFVTTFNELVVPGDSIFPTSPFDADNKFILRMAYDETAILDSEYAKGTLSCLTLFADAGDTGSVINFYHSSSQYGVYNTIDTELTNPYNVPDFVTKTNIELMQPHQFYKVGHRYSESVDRVNNFISEITDANDMIQQYHIGSSNLDNQLVTSIRTFQIVYGSDLDLCYVADYEIEASFGLPASVVVDDAEIANRLDSKHYYEFATNYIKAQNMGFLGNENVANVDGTFTAIQDTTINEYLQSYYVAGAPNTDDFDVLRQWSSPGGNLPEGSHVSSSYIANKFSTQTYANDMISINFENGAQMYIGGETRVLSYDTQDDVVRYVKVMDLDTDDSIFAVDGTHTKISSIDAVIFENQQDVYIMDMQEIHNFILETNGFMALLVVHNALYCFPAGTQIAMADGSSKNIEDVVEGDLVISYNEKTKEKEAKKVIGTQQPIHNDIVKYTLSNGLTISSTFDHPFYTNLLQLASFAPQLTNSKYELDTNVIKIKKGDVLYTLPEENEIGLHAVAVQSIEPQPAEDTQTYIITVEDNHNFFANNILVHNK